MPSRILLRAGAALLTCFCAATATAARARPASTRTASRPATRRSSPSAEPPATRHAPSRPRSRGRHRPTARPLLRTAGWAPLRAAANDDPNVHDIVATRGHAALRIRRPGAAPDLDGWAAGRELLFARPLARRRPAAAAGSGRLHVGLPDQPAWSSGRAQRRALRWSAQGRHDAPAQRRAAPAAAAGDRARRRAAQRPAHEAARRARRAGAVGSDATGGRGHRSRRRRVRRGSSSAPHVRRPGAASASAGARAASTSAASSSTAPPPAPTASRAGARARTCSAPRSRRAAATAAGPSTPRPRADGTVRAVGITTLVFGLFQTMCFTPLSPVLDALNAQLVTAPAS